MVLAQIIASTAEPAWRSVTNSLWAWTSIRLFHTGRNPGNMLYSMVRDNTTSES